MAKQAHTIENLDLATDADTIVALTIDAQWDDDLWQPTCRNCPREEQHKFMKGLFSAFGGPNFRYFGIKDNGKTVGYTCLQVPGPQTEEEKEMESGEHMPPTPPGMHHELMKEMFGFLGSAIPEGYNPEQDLHRRGTMIHPDFQKRGMGTALTKHCNKISDEAGGRTWVPVRPSSKKMFMDLGFVPVKEIFIDMKKYPDVEDTHVAENWLLLRQAQN